MYFPKQVAVWMC